MSIGSIFGGGGVLGIMGIMGGPWGLILSQVMQQLIGTIMREVINELPISNMAKNLLGEAVDRTFGPPVGGSYVQQIDRFADQNGLNLLERAGLHQVAKEFRDTASDIVRNMLRQAEDAQDDRTRELSGRGGGKGWIRVMAEQMGRMLDKAWHETEALAKQINKEDPSTSAAYQGAVQEFGFLMQSFTTAIKAAGEAAQSMARKQ
jgi:hypothetical protein